MRPPAAASAQPRPAIEIRDLYVEMGGVEILHGVNAVFRKGEITALIGPNGAGKTTLLLAVLDIIPYRGEIKIHTKKSRGAIGYVPQHLDFDRGMPATVTDFLCLGRQRLPVWLFHGKSKKAHALEALSWVDAERLSRKRLGSLSGGEMQRVLLAMALMERPEIILLDEPASAVDRSGEEIFLKLVKRLHAERDITFLMVSHDLTMVTRLADQVICLNRVVLSEGRTADVLNEPNLAACFGADKGVIAHRHGWDAELSCAYEDWGGEKGEGR